MFVISPCAVINLNLNLPLLSIGKCYTNDCFYAISLYLLHAIEQIKLVVLNLSSTLTVFVVVVARITNMNICRIYINFPRVLRGCVVENVDQSCVPFLLFPMSREQITIFCSVTDESIS